MHPPPLKDIVEAALLAAGGPLTQDRLLGLFAEEERPTGTDLEEVIGRLRQDYAERGIEVVEVAGGWRIQVCQHVAPWVARLWEERPPRYSRALLETLALIAYRQPITRGEIEEIRGVAVSTQIVKTLTEREWIRVVGHRDVPGRPALYATTRKFLEYFGLRSLNELPTLAEIRDPDFLIDGELALEIAVEGLDAASSATPGVAFDPAAEPNGDAALADPESETHDSGSARERGV
jgi:segregation and condensation protein B